MAMDLVTIVEWGTIVVTFVMMASGSPICINMYRNKSTKNVPYLLFLMAAFISILGLTYGMAIANSNLIFIQAVATLVWGIYVGVYILVSKSKSAPTLQLMTMILFYGLHVVYIRSLPVKEIASSVGALLKFWCIINSLIPCLDIVQMMKEKSAACVDMSLLLGATLSASVWYTYGVLLDDVNIYLPCVPAFVVNGTKFFLLFWYGSGLKQHTGPVANGKVHETSNGVNPSADFHQEVFKVESRDGLRQRM